MESLTRLLALAAGAAFRATVLQAECARGYAAAALALGDQRLAATEVTARIPPGMLEALCIAGAAGRATPALDLHYTRAMPSLLARQLRAHGGAEEKLFDTKLSLDRLPRLHQALDSLFALVAAAGLSCAQTLGAATPKALLRARPTLGALYAGCHFGSSMPMLYAYPGDLEPAAWAGRSAEELIDARLVGPLIHELSHLQVATGDAPLVPAPANLHEALAAWLGSLAWPAQIWPAEATLAQPRGGEDALPGGAYFAAVGAFVARAITAPAAIRVQAGALDLRDAREGLGAQACEALRLFGWFHFLETGAPHLLADAFEPARWWKLIDLHRDPALASDFYEAQILPLLSGPVPAPGEPIEQRWFAALDALPWSALPSFRDGVTPADVDLAERACRALQVRTVREGATFRARREALPPWPRGSGATGEVLGKGPLRLDVEACILSSAHQGADVIGAPAHFPYPPALCAAYAARGFREVRGPPGGLPSVE